MSIDATRATWKLGKEVTAIQKILLLSLADRAGESSECWPCIKRLEQDTNLNRKTIIENRQILIEKGLISYTGEYKGNQNQIPVMKLMYVQHREDNAHIDKKLTNPKNGTGKKFTSTENGTGTGPKNGTGTSTENGTQNLKEESKRITTTVVVDFSSEKYQKLLKAYDEAKEIDVMIDTREKFIDYCNWSIANKPANISVLGRIKGIIKCLDKGITIEDAWIKSKIDLENDILEPYRKKYQEYYGYTKQMISYGSFPKSTPIMEFNEWLDTQEARA